MLGTILRRILRVASQQDRIDFAQKLLRDSSSEYRAFSDLFIPAYRKDVDWRSGLVVGHQVLYSLVRVLRPKTIVEIGSARGLSTCAMSLACRQNGSGKVFAIDPHDRNSWAEGEGSSLDFLNARLRDYELTDWCNILQSYSTRAAEGWSQQIDLLFIDGDHTYEGVSQDFELFRHYLTDRSIVIFHDTLWEYQKEDPYYRTDMGVPRFLAKLKMDGYQSVTLFVPCGLTLLYPKVGGFDFVPQLAVNESCPLVR